MPGRRLSERPARLRGAQRYLLGLGMIGMAAGVTWVARPSQTAYPPPSTSFVLDVGRGRRSVTLGIRSVTGATHRVTVTADTEQASFVHRETEAAYTLALGTRAEGDGRLVVGIDPPASVAVDPERSAAPAVRPRLVWGPAPPSLVLPAPIAAGPARGEAEASVDETDVYGLRLFGVPVRAAPRTAAAVVATVSHGDRLKATCWATGDPVSNGFATNPAGEAYESDVWFVVATSKGPGYIPDVRYARRGGTDRLGLPSCP